MLNTNERFRDFSNKVDDHSENSSENEYLKKMLDIFDDIAKPADFDTWTAQQQRDWVHQSVKKYFPDVPETLQNLVPAEFRLIVFDRSQEKLPEWVDIDKYHRGQKFVREHYFSLVVATLFGSIYSFTYDDGLKPIIIAGNSHTPYLAFKRYLNTVKRMFVWYDGEPWIKDTEAYREMEIVRKKHMMINNKISKINYEQYHTASKFEDPWCPEYELFLKNFAVTCPSAKPKQRSYKIFDNFSYKPESMNNCMMTVAQANFIILPILYPQNIGIHSVTDEDLEAFSHMWKCYGYFLGIEDEYNICRGSFEEIKQRLRDLTQYWTLVNFTEISQEFVHITKCMIESTNYYPLLYVPYKAIVLFFMEALNVNMPNLYASLSYTDWIVYKIYRFIFHHMLKFSRVRLFFNKMIYKVIEAALNFDPEKLAKLHEKSKQEVPDFFINL